MRRSLRYGTLIFREFRRTNEGILEVRPTFAALTKKATKRVCMGKNPSYHIWGAPDFCLHPSTRVLEYWYLGAV